MGDCCACEYAQAAHVGVLRHFGLLSSSELLLPTHPFPRSLLSVGIVIDSSFWSGRPDAPGVRRLDSVHAAYVEARLEANPKKGVRDAAVATFWGAKLSGDDGLLRPSPSRVWPVAFVTARVAALGLVSRSLLESLVGSWTSIFLVRRRALCLIDVAFQALRATVPGDVIRLSAALSDELWSWVIVAPLCVANLRAQVCDCFFTTDASDDKIACAVADLPPQVADECYRHTLVKGAWNRLLPPSQAWLRSRGLLPESAELPGEDSYTPFPLWRELAQALRFRTAWVLPAAAGQHINIKELRGLLELERRVARTSSGLRLLVGIDSQVIFGAALKGRSASGGLNTLLKRFLATMFGSDLYLGRGTYEPQAKLCRRGSCRGDTAPFETWLAAQPEVVAQRAKETFLPEMVDRLALRWSSGKARRARRNRALRACGTRRSECPLRGSLALGDSCSALAVLAGLPRGQFFPEGGALDFSKKGALELFSGSSGVARGLARRGAPWVLTFDIEHGPDQDLDNDTVQKMIELLLRAQVFLSFGASPPCSSFSRAVHPPWRSRAHPRGLPGLGRVAFVKVTKGNRQADWVAHVLRAFRANSDGHFWIEGPDGSFMWLLAGFAEFAPAVSPSTLRVDQCRFGTRWRKRTRFAVCDSSALAGERLFCNCSRPHLVLRGRAAPDNRSWTSIAQAYPRPLAELVAAAAAIKAGWTSDGHRLLQIPLSACVAGAPTARLGEASHPGPRGRRLFRDSTVGLESPALLAMALRAYGNWLFKNSRSIHDFRHTILGAQRRFLNLKPWASHVWELVSRWEHAEPVQHRTPVPEPVLKALVALAWLSGFVAFAAVTLLSYYGLGRIGEVLPVLRSDLLLPSDDWWNQSRAAYLTLRSSKTMNRKRGRIQHMKITDAKAVALLEKLYGNRPGGYRLFPQSPSAYRYRWNKLLETLSVPAEARLTPGGLRGGGAVQSYRSGVAITEIQWRMRLRHIHTLEFYLQEVGAASALTALSQACAAKVRTAGTFYELLLAADKHVSKHSLKMPWERGAMRAVFSQSDLSSLSQCSVPAPLQTEPLDSASFEEAAAKAHPQEHASQFVQVAFSARKFQKPQETEEQQLQLLATRYDILLSHAYECSSLGRLLKDKCETDRVSLVAEALGGKALSTLKKRLSSLARLVGWCSNQGMSAFPIDSQVLIEYTQHLQQSGASHSVFGSCIEACNFARFILGVDATGEPHKHPLVQGRLRKVRFNRPPRVQARPFQVREVAYLEAFVQDSRRDARDRYAAGACLFCIHSRARVGDVRAVKAMFIDFAEGEGFLECISTSHKCASTGNPLGLELSLVAPERGVGQGLWAKAWVEVWRLSGHPVATGSCSLPLLQSPMLNGSWSGRRIPTGRFVTWISSILKSGDESMGFDFKGHSCKHTALSWASKTDMSKDSCTILGHHSLKDRRSVVTYSRDIQAGPLRELCQMYCDIRCGRYLPDMTRSGLYAKGPASADSAEELPGDSVFETEAERNWYRPAVSPGSACDSEALPCANAFASEPGLSDQRDASDDDTPFSRAVDSLIHSAERAAWEDPDAAFEDDRSQGEEPDSSSSESSSDSGSSDSEIDEVLTASQADPPVGQRYHDRCPVYQQKNTRIQLCSMASILKSQAAFEERAKECGLTQAELDVLVRKGLTSLSLLAFSVSTPGEVPQEAELRSILDPADPTTVPLRALSALRRLMFEAQTLSIAQLKSSIEGEGEKKAELAPAERTNRITDQRKRLVGLSLTGPLENAFSNYTYVAQVVDQDCLSYLEPHRFLTRAMEVNREKPGKELILDEGSRMSIRDKAHKDKCGIQNELQLSEALCRRALACDLLQLCTFASMDLWHRHLLAKLSEQPPPYYAKVSMEQLLRCDKAAWVRMSELLTSLKKDDAGNLPMDAALDKLQYDPKIMMHLAPLPGAKWKGDGKGDKGTKRDADGKPKLPPHRPGKGAGKGKCPEALSDSRLKHNCSKTKKRLCWNFNMQAGCKFAKPGESCKRGLHICMFCEQPHSLLQCTTYKVNE
ncbi:unnamed protein product [Symbiodinium sp. CCMP2592]|nr:unnamed protein product [Symbiodinium sp. CCMP2592]